MFQKFVKFVIKMIIFKNHKVPCRNPIECLSIRYVLKITTEISNNLEFWFNYKNSIQLKNGSMNNITFLLICICASSMDTESWWRTRNTILKKISKKTIFFFFVAKATFCVSPITTSTGTKSTIKKNRRKRNQRNSKYLFY